jgi:quinoprotein glucose dehydrogenase
LSSSDEPGAARFTAIFKKSAGFREPFAQGPVCYRECHGWPLQKAETIMDDQGRRCPRWLALLLVLVGAAYTVGGAILAGVGGSLYYLCAGVAMVVAGVLAWARRRGWGWVYLLVTVASVVWALAEAGFDFWKLIPRLDVILGLGVLLLIPWPRRRSGAPRQPAADRPAARGTTPPAAAGTRLRLAVAGAAVAIGCGVAMALQPSGDPEPAAQTPVSPAAASANATAAGADWPEYGGTAGGDRYSSLDQLTPQNVARLRPAWTYHTGEKRHRGDPPEYTFEVAPLKIRDTVYLCTPHNVIVALDAETGTPRWRYDPHIASTKGYVHLTCRGVAYHEARNPAPGDDCPRRILEGTADARLIAVNADTGVPCRGFGRNGEVDLKLNMGPIKPGFYYPSSAPLIVHDAAVVGGWVADDQSTDEPSGVVRAYDVTTGALKWNFDSGNPDHTEPLPAGQTYVRNSSNAWGPLAADPALGLVFLPMGIQTPDTWGGLRTPASEKYGTSLIAVDADSGRVRWSFQTVHHDLWDMDIGAQPTLVDMPTPQGMVPAVIAITKRGDLFVLDRRSGQPLVPVTERPVPSGAAEGDHVAPTQPFSALSFTPQRPLRESDMWGATPFDQMWCRARFRRLRYEGIFTPPSVQGSLVFPGNYGIFDWGGIAADPVHHTLFVTPTYVAFTSRLVPRPKPEPEPELPGEEPEPEQGPTQAAPAANTQTAPGGHVGTNPQWGTPFAVELKPFLSPLNIPCQAPPWGYVAQVDLKTQKVAWEHKNGTTRDNMPFHLPIAFPVGVPGLGGPLITAGGLGFYSGTLDNYLRAYDLSNGREIWKARLPAGGQATPVSYRSERSGRQFIVIAAGGHSGLGTTSGDAVIAYALPAQASGP